MSMRSGSDQGLFKNQRPKSLKNLNLIFVPHLGIFMLSGLRLMLFTIHRRSGMTLWEVSILIDWDQNHSVLGQKKATFGQSLEIWSRAAGVFNHVPFSIPPNDGTVYLQACDVLGYSTFPLFQTESLHSLIPQQRSYFRIIVTMYFPIPPSATSDPSPLIYNSA